MTALAVPAVDALEQAGKLPEDLPRLWDQATVGEQHRILGTLIDAVYVDPLEEKRIIALKPKAAFRALFEVATTRSDSGVELLIADGLPQVEENESPQRDALRADGLCLRWRRGRVELHLKHHLRVLLVA